MVVVKTLKNQKYVWWGMVTWVGGSLQLVKMFGFNQLDTLLSWSSKTKICPTENDHVSVEQGSGHLQFQRKGLLCNIVDL